LMVLAAMAVPETVTTANRAAMSTIDITFNAFILQTSIKDGNRVAVVEFYSITGQKKTDFLVSVPGLEHVIT
jgi:hypothetical protein